MTEQRDTLMIELGEHRILQPGRLRWLRALAWTAALFLIVPLTFGPAMAAIREMLPKDPHLEFFTRLTGAVIALAAYAVLVRLGEARSAREVALKPALVQTLIGLALGLSMFSAVMIVMVAFGLYDVSFIGPAPAWRAAGLAIEAGVVEELLVRAVLLRLLWRAFGPLPAFLVSAAAFGAGHLPNQDSSLFAAVCIAVEAGIMLGAFYVLTGRLWVSIGVHMAWNFAQGYLFGAAVSGGDLGPAIARSTARANAPEWLTGGAFGPEASLPALLVCGSVGAVTLWRAWKTGRITGSSTSNSRSAHANKSTTAPTTPDAQSADKGLAS